MTVERWFTPEAIRATRCTERQLDYWRRCGYLRPDGEQGSGYLWRWSFDDLLRATVIRSVSPPAKGKSNGAVQRIGPRIAIASLDGEFLVLEPYLAFRDPDQIVDLVARHPCVTVVALGNLRGALRERLAV